jgi:CDP-4-dehydro-6-deoxyglucose reductase
MPKPAWHPARFREALPESPNTKHFVFEVTDTEAFDFQPGQFVKIDMPIDEDPSKRSRSYSIASRPDGSNALAFSIVRKEGGAGTGWLFEKAASGDTVQISDPLGRMVLPNADTRGPIEQDLVFIATGTGVGPFRSMLLDLMAHPRPHRTLHLVFGCRRQEDLLYADEFRQMEKDLEGFHYHPTLSREQVDGIHHGYVHPIYEQLAEGRHGDPDLCFYICGWGDMVHEARRNLKDMGFGRRQIHVESYD